MDKRVMREGVFYLTPGAIFAALLAKYVGLSGYGVWAAIVEIPTFAILGGPTFAVLWASLVALFAGLAVGGVLRTWATGRAGLEMVGSFAFVCIFLGYSFALIYRSVDLGNPGTAPLAVIPFVISVLPAIRFASLLPRKKKVAA